MCIRDSNGMVHAGRFEAGGMEDGDDIARSRTLKVLIALRGAVIEKTARGVGEKRLRLYFGIYCLAENVVKGETKDEGTQIVDAGDAAEVVPKGIFGAKLHLVSPLVHRRSSDAAVEDPEVVQVHIGLFARSC